MFELCVILMKKQRRKILRRLALLGYPPAARSEADFHDQILGVLEGRPQAGELELACARCPHPLVDL